MTKDETMKLALEALKELNEENSYWWQEVDESTLKKLISAEKSLEEALANHILDDTKMVSGVKDSLTTQQEQGKSFFKFRECEDSQANTTPQQRKPLSEAAIEGLAKFVAVDDFNYDFARAIEKAHGIKENT
jgi:hypothetical protein